MVSYLDPEVEEQLEEDDPELLAVLRRKRQERLNRKWPQPDQSDVIELRERLKVRFDPLHTIVRRVREQRYLRHKLPKDVREKLGSFEMYRSGSTHNEIRRVVATLTANYPKFEILPAGTSKKARERADQQTRWANEWLPAMEREFGSIFYKLADALAEANFVVPCLYVTGSYDDLEEELVQRPHETDAVWKRRREKLLTQCGSPMGIQIPDPLATYFDPDEDIVIYDEVKPERHIYRWILDNYGLEAAEEWKQPRPKARGTPYTSGVTSSAENTVRFTTYYDNRWVAYLIDDQLIDGPHEHGFGANPAVPFEGFTSSSHVLEERLSGMTYAQLDDERFLDIAMTERMARTFRFALPALAIQSKDSQAHPFLKPNGDPMTIRFGGPDAPVLPPGYEVTDVNKDHRPVDMDPFLGFLQASYQRKGLNPVAQGESPGADPSGFALSLLSGNAQRMYEVLGESLARGLGKLCDRARIAVRDHPEVSRAPWYLSIAGTEGKRGEGGAWLSLDKDGVDETPCKVTIDPSSDASFAARYQILSNALQARLVPRRVVQIRGLNSPDPTAWDEEIDIDEKQAMLNEKAFEQALAEVQAEIGAGQNGAGPGGLPGLGDGPGGGGPPQQAPGPAGPPPASTVGPEMAGASRVNPYAGQQPPGRVPPVPEGRSL